MKINIADIDRENFIVSERDFHGEKVYLITPNHVGSTWNKNNLIFRSSVWNEQGEPISLSFPKFFNYGEQLELSPPPQTLEGTSIVEKMDGSLLCVSYYKGHLMARTRGTIDATTMSQNGVLVGDEVIPLLEKYGVPELLQSEAYQNVSLIFEWVGERHQVVIPYPEPEIYLIGGIFHEDYSLFNQQSLDTIAGFTGIKRPQRFSFDSVEDMTERVTAFDGLEGVCLYSNSDQTIHKVKASAYLALHRAKENCNYETILDVYLSMGQPDYDIFQAEIPFEWKQFELKVLTDGFINEIFEKRKEINSRFKEIQDALEKIKQLPTRKEQAMEVIKQFPKHKAYCFTMLDGKEVKIEDIKKLYME